MADPVLIVLPTAQVIHISGEDFTGPSKNPLKDMLQHIHIYPLGDFQRLADLCHLLLSQGETKTFVCAIGNVLPQWNRKIPSQTPCLFETDHTNLISPHFAEAVIIIILKVIRAANYPKPNQTNARAGKHSFECRLRNQTCRGTTSHKSQRLHR